MPRRSPGGVPAPATSVRGVRFGHATAPGGRTGVTVVVFDLAAPTVVATLGGASATFDTGSLALDATFGRRWALFFAGGSVFGLDAARGVRDAVLAAGGGHTVFGHLRKVAPVSGAALFDLPADDRPLPDYARLGAAAVRAARQVPPAVGPVGAGAGATVGKYLGRGHAAPGGVGFAVRPCGAGAVAALVAVNSVGAIVDPATGRWVAGARADGRIVPPPGESSRWKARREPPRGTTLVAIVTDVPADRRTLARAGAIAAAGLARVVVPTSTATDGDVVFVATTREATGESPRPVEADRLGVAAAEAVVAAVLTAVAARPGPSRPARVPRSHRRRARAGAGSRAGPGSGRRA